MIWSWKEKGVREETALREGIPFSSVQANSLSWWETLISDLPGWVSAKTWGAENKCLSDKQDT